jgi:hypothetical protein
MDERPQTVATKTATRGLVALQKFEANPVRDKYYVLTEITLLTN